MTLRLFSATAATLLVAFSVVAQVPPAATEPAAELTLKPVPPLLRLHLPVLGEKRGVLIQAVAPGSAAAKAGLRGGDVLLEAGGRGIIAGDSLGPMDPSFPIVVLRRGRTRVLHPTAMGKGLFGGRFAPPFPADPQGGTRISTSAVSSGSGSRAVSISRAGDQFAIEMSLPELAEESIRLRGTAAEIEQQLQSGKFSEAIRREVRTVLQQAR